MMSVERAASQSSLRVVIRGIRLSPELLQGIWLTLLLAVFATAGRVVVPIVVQQAIDRGFTDPERADVPVVLTTAGIGLVVLLLTGLCQVLMNRRLIKASERALASMRVATFQRIHELSGLAKQGEQRGAMVSRVTTDVDAVTGFIAHGGLQMVILLGQLVLATAVMAWYSVPLMLVVWACYLPVFGIMGWIQRRVRSRFVAVRRRTGAMMGSLSESLAGVSTVRAYGFTTQARLRNEESIEQVREAQFKTMRPLSVNFVTPELADGLTTAIVIVVGIWLGTSFDLLTPGQMVSFLFLIALFSQPVRQGIELLSNAQQAVAGWARVLEVLDTPVDIPEAADPVVLADRAPAIEFDRVSFTYPGSDRPVIEDLSVAIPPASTVAIVGETGSGKTTLAKLATRLMDIDRGSIRIDGLDLREIGFDSLRRRVLMVPQEGFLFDTTLRENLLFAAPEASEEQIGRALVELGIADWVGSLPEGLDTPVGARGDALSAGERQLVALARAHLAGPRALVLDEATSAVDPGADVRLQRAIEGLSGGRTTLTIAHRLSTAEHADLILVMDQGRLVEQGDHRTLLAHDGRYAELHRSWVAKRGQ